MIRDAAAVQDNAQQLIHLAQETGFGGSQFSASHQHCSPAVGKILGTARRD
jgi:hypothetical protein